MCLFVSLLININTITQNVTKADRCDDILWIGPGWYNKQVIKLRW